MTGEEPRNILKYTMKYADTTYARQCTYMSLLKTYSCEYCKFSVYYKDETTRCHTCCLSHPDWVHLRRVLG